MLVVERNEAKKIRGELKIVEREAYSSDMNLAQHAWENRDTRQVEELLDRYAGRNDLTGFEWV